MMETQKIGYDGVLMFEVADTGDPWRRCSAAPTRASGSRAPSSPSPSNRALHSSVGAGFSRPVRPSISEGHSTRAAFPGGRARGVFPRRLTELDRTALLERGEWAG